MRQIVLDTETTGLEPAENHRIIEIGCIELIDRRHTGNEFWHYLNPQRDIDEGAFEVHGIAGASLSDKPIFKAVADELIGFLKGAELIIHNAAFDIAFVNHELARLGGSYGRIEDYCNILDTLALARQMHPGQKNSLEALCKRYSVDDSAREQHGALLDARILADVYLAMTGGQGSLELANHRPSQGAVGLKRWTGERPRLAVIAPSAKELADHEACLAKINDASQGACVWERLGDAT